MPIEGENFPPKASTEVWRRIYRTTRRMRPTLRHRPALHPGLLFTVYAHNEAGECKYFDYDYDGALEFAGIKEGDPDIDLRVFRPRERTHYGCIATHEQVVYVLRKEVRAEALEPVGSASLPKEA
jgi:hypothetical protein